MAAYEKAWLIQMNAPSKQDGANLYGLFITVTQQFFRKDKGDIGWIWRHKMILERRVVGQ